MSNSVQPHRQKPTRLHVPGILQARTLEWVAISFSNARNNQKTEQSITYSGKPSQKENKEVSPVPDGLLVLEGFPGQGTWVEPRQNLCLLEQRRYNRSQGKHGSESSQKGAWGGGLQRGSARF